MTLEARVTRECHKAGLAGGHGCKGTKCTLFETAAGPSPEVGLSFLQLLVDCKAGFGPLGALWCGPNQGAGPCAEEGPGCKVVMRILGKDARKRCAGQRCKLHVLCMQEGRGKGLLLHGVQGCIGRCLCRLIRQGCPWSLKQVQPGSHYFAP